MNYYGIWKLFNKFFLRLDIKPLSWEERLVLFTGYLIEEGKKSTTIRSYLSAVRSVLKTQGFQLNEDTYLISALTWACKLKNNKIRTRLPIKKSLLHTILDKIQILYENSYEGILFRTMFAIAYHGMFRIGEVTEGPHAIKAKDVEIGTNKKKLKFTLHSLKTHGPGDKLQIVKISSEPCQGKGNARHCPFLLMRQFLQLRTPQAISNENFFVYRNGESVKPAEMREVLRLCLSLTDKNPDHFTVHGLRAGKATELLNLGVSVETFKKLGRWKSNAVFAYLR